HGHALKLGKDGIMICPESGFHYKEVSPGILKCLDLNEEDPLPEKLAKGSDNYRTIKEKSK
ncbi:MAG: N-acetyltransferase, partial [Candidatus Saganbacteria bacterium]|nr:N-acetyltransferase [Candidatus Saganbacteria bacterium]